MNDTFNLRQSTDYQLNELTLITKLKQKLIFQMDCLIKVQLQLMQILTTMSLHQQQTTP